MSKTYTNETNYKVEVIDSSKELTVKDKIRVKDVSNAIRLDEATQIENITIDIDSYVVLDIFNEKADDKNYRNYVIIGKDGNKYVTGSESFWRAFIDIFGEMTDAGEQDNITIEVYRLPSKNYKGKDFLTCSIV